MNKLLFAYRKFRKRLSLSRFTTPEKAGIVHANIEGFKMRLNLCDGGIGNTLYSSGGRELAFMAILREQMKPGMTCLDIGANIGYPTLHMAAGVGPEGRTFAVEPDPRNISQLKQNLALNDFLDRTEVMQGAFSDADGKLDIWLSKKPNLNSVIKCTHSQEKITVPTFSLESFFDRHGHASFAKMDIEGHEVSVLKGGYDYFKKTALPCAFLMEVHPSFYSDANDFIAIVDKYFGIGFYPKLVVSTPVAQPQFFKERKYTPKRSIPTDSVVRGIYDDVSKEDFLDSMKIVENKVVRSFLLVRD